MPGRQRDDEVAMSYAEGTRQNDQRPLRLLRECIDCALDLGSVTHAGAGQFHPECRRGSLDGLHICKLCRAPPPLPQKLPIAPIFIADSVSLAVSREKDGKLRL